MTYGAIALTICLVVGIVSNVLAFRMAVAMIGADVGGPAL